MRTGYGSRTQGAERHDEHAVVAAVGLGSHTDENHQEGDPGSDEPRPTTHLIQRESNISLILTEGFTRPIRQNGQEFFSNLAESGPFSFLFVDSYFRKISPERFF